MGAVMAEPEYELPLADAAGGMPQTAVYVLARISGEGSDRDFVKGDILLTDTEIRDILELNRSCEHFMLVLNVGGPVDLSPVAEVGNILVLSQLGVETGSVLADILLGKAYPSGKLTTTWTKAQDYPEIGDFGDRNNTHYREGVYVGYRYFDSVGIAPMFPFGYGLGYTDFQIELQDVTACGLACQKEAADPVDAAAGSDLGSAASGCISVQVKVKNTGSFPGKETVQIYIAPPQAELDKPLRTLAAFDKTRELQPGEEQILSIPVDIRSAASYDEKTASWLLEKGDYIVLVTNGNFCKLNSEAELSAEEPLTNGRSSFGVPAAVMRLDETVVLEKLNNLLGKPDFTDWKPEKAPEAIEADYAKVKVIELHADSFGGRGGDRFTENSGDRFRENKVDRFIENNGDSIDKCSEGKAGDSVESESVDPAIAALTDEELAYLGVGGFSSCGGALSIIGNASSTVAGAAGEISDHYPGGKKLVMSDGPAGLRISKDYYRDEKGVHALGSTIPETISELMPRVVTKLMALTAAKPKKDTEILHQYCTAIPIGTALAQSWNPEFAGACGDIVGSEMERFGIHLWLAPALNIHRSIRCGRNFEYFSEDPLISGIFAAAITDGVQKHPGCGVTIKHIAANNQETNRYRSNSIVSERAMREIYLKGFEIAVRRSQPHAVMTSYNLLNGVHTSERRDLTSDILRGEWGFRGIVMTDWVVGMGSSKDKEAHPVPEAWKVAAAGGDLFMPGGKPDYKNVLAALKDGRLSRKQLEENAARVLRLAEKLN